MRHMGFFLMFFFIVGCDGANVPKEKYFSGETVEHWLGAMKSPKAKERKKAATVLGNVGTVDPRSITALIESIGDKDATVRDAAVLSLSKIGPPALAAEKALTEATRDPDAMVRSHAGNALERLRGTK